ncbi:MAG: hypothetical protein ACPGO3_03750 [Magnetospiraceae bacterium]
MRPWILVLALLTAACGDPAPVAVWNINLDVDCQPADPVDWLRAKLSAESFWAEQKYDLEIRATAAARNIKRSEELYNENRLGRDAFRGIVRQRARELNLSGAAMEAMVADNMADFDAEGAAFKAKMDSEIIALRWAEDCLGKIPSR